MSYLLSLFFSDHTNVTSFLKPNGLLLSLQGFIQVLPYVPVTTPATCLGSLSGKDQIPTYSVNHSQRLQITDPSKFLDFFFLAVCQVRKQCPKRKIQQMAGTAAVAPWTTGWEMQWFRGLCVWYLALAQLQTFLSYILLAHCCYNCNFNTNSYTW